jgi:hypothetical protein
MLSCWAAVLGPVLWYQSMQPDQRPKKEEAQVLEDQLPKQNVHRMLACIDSHVVCYKPECHSSRC